MRMIPLAALASLAALTTAPAPARADMPSVARADTPGLVSARLLPGWVADDGSRIAALELVLAPGWKTYWRNPGDSGVAPVFDWAGSANLGAVRMHWPAPEAIISGGDQTWGYHDRLVLPFTAAPATPGQPVTLAARVDFGLCDDICVPAHVDLAAPAPGPAPDPVIAAAMAAVPGPAAPPACALAATDDGASVAITLPPGADAAMIEVANAPDLWVSVPQLAAGRATAQVLAPDLQPLDLDPAAVTVTLFGPAGTTEAQGCAPA